MTNRIQKKPAITINYSVTNSKFDSLYGCWEFLIDGIKLASDMMVLGKMEVVVGFADMGKDYVQAVKGFRVQVIITKINSTESFHKELLGDYYGQDL